MIGNGTIPRFWNTNAGYNDDGKMDTCDLVIKVDKELANSTALLFRSFEIPSLALYSGDRPLWIIIPFELIKMMTKGVSPIDRISDLAASLGKHLRKMLKTFDGISIFSYESSIPTPYSVADDGKSIYLPVRLEEVYKLSPEMAFADNIGIPEDLNSYVPLDENENVANFFNKIVL
jgi:hypothetical protein